MGQYWTMVDLTRRCVIPGIEGKLGSCFMDAQTALEALLKGDIFRGEHYLSVASYDISNGIQRQVSSSHIVRSLQDMSLLPSISSEDSALLCLPNELLAQILLAVESQVDRYCFGLTCRRLFSLMETHWLVHIADQYKCQDRPRILCMGDEANPPWDCLPPSCQTSLRAFQLQLATHHIDTTEDEREELLDLDHPYTILERMPEISTALCTIKEPLGRAVLQRLHKQRVQERPCNASMHSNLSPMPEDKVLHMSLFDSHLPDPGLCRCDDPGPPTLWYAPESGIFYVLRNHTKKVFVLENPFITAFAKCNQSQQISVTLGHVALSQCCRSTDSGTLMAPEISEEIINGPWAGDELDIVSERAFRMSFRSGSEVPSAWKNDGPRVLNLMWEIFASECSFNDIKQEKVEGMKSIVWSQVMPGKTVEDLLGDVPEYDDDVAESKEKERYQQFRTSLHLNRR